MSEEEEKAIKFLKALKDNYKKQTEAIVRSHNGDVYKEEENAYKYIVEQMENVLNYIDKLQKENFNYRVANKLLEDEAYKDGFEERKKLQKENEELKEENEKINKAADKMYEYISYYGWEDFESNTGCNREEMVDYFYKE